MNWFLKHKSATFIRQQMSQNAHWQSYVPKEAAACFADAPLHRLENGEQAILYKLRTMDDSDFEALPYGSEGLWRKLMHAARQCSNLEQIIAATKSKRYTRTRIDRMIMCAYLGITEEMLKCDVPHVRILGFNKKGRDVLKIARNSGTFLNIGQQTDNWYQHLENRCGTLYGLFAKTAEPPDTEQKSRVISL